MELGGMVGQSRGRGTMVVNSTVNNDITDLQHRLEKSNLCVKMSTERNKF